MKRKFTILLAAMLLMSGLTWAQTTLNIAEYASANSWVNGTQYLNVEVGDVTFTATGGSNTGKYYSSDQSWRFYANENAILTISVPSGSSLVSVTPTFTVKDNGILVYNGDNITSESAVNVSGEEVVFTISQSGGNKGKVFFTEVEVVYTSGGTSTVAMPTFNPASGTEFGNEGLQVSISCETEGVDLYYTLDGSEPDDESNPYNGPISLTETTTIKAIAYDGNDNTSYVATATYIYVDPTTPGTENNPYTVAQARAAIDAGTGTQGVYATGIVSEIPTAWNTQYSNITFNMVDEEGDEDFLQAFRCGGDEAADVAVGDIVVVYGNLTYYQNTQTYEFGQGCQLVSLTHPVGYVEAPTFNPAGGTYDEAQTVTISCANADATIYYTLDGSEPTNANTQYTTAINVTTTTTIKAIAYVGTDASAVTTATYNIVSLANISDITEVDAAYEVQGTVVATNSRGFVMGDGTGFVYYYKNGAVSQSIGDMVKISGITGTYGQIIQFTNTATVTEATTSNYNGTPAATIITEVPDYTQGYHLSTYLEFEGALTKTSGNYLITLGDAQIQISYPTTGQGNALTALNGKNVHVKGYFAGINSSDKFTVMLENVEEVVSTEPVINANDITLAYDASSGEIEYTITNPVAGTVLNATTDAEWISNIVVGETSITFNVTENEGTEDRTATVTLTYAGAQNTEVTVTQEHFVVDYATLPFAFDGGRADIANTDGLTQEGLDSDYGSSPKLKFNSTDDYVLLHFQGTPGTLTFDVKGNSFSGGTFTVQTSEDGELYTDLATYTELGATQNEEFADLGENVRYIKWIYTNKSSGNVALGNITLAKPVTDPVITVNPDIVDAAAEGGNGTLAVTYQNIADITANVFFCDAEGAAATYTWITAEVKDDNDVEYTINANDGEARTAYLKVNVGETYSNLVTINQAAYVVPPTLGEWVLTNLADLTENDVFVIVGDNGDTYAMSNDNGTEAAPTAVAVTVVDNTLSGEIAANLQWNISITDDGYIFYPNGETETWLYCTNTNNGVRVGVGEAKHFTMDEANNYLTITETSDQRYIGIYNSQDWRCYKLGTDGSFPANIENQAFAFYKKVTSSQTTTQTVELASGTNWFSTYVDITLEELQSAIQDALGTSVNATLKSRDANIRYTRGRWGNTPSNFVWDVALMYKIEVAAACEFTLEGMPLDPAEHTITLAGNGTYNWIGFPFAQSMSLTDAFAGFAVNGDAIKGKVGNNKYSRGRWSNSGLTTLEPGQGYMYQLGEGETRDLVYPNPGKSVKSDESPMAPQAPNSVKRIESKTLDLQVPQVPGKSTEGSLTERFKNLNNK